MSTQTIDKQFSANAAYQTAHIRIDDNFDTELAHQLAERESYNKHLYRPNTYLHKWWARRCGTTFRAILKHLVEREELSGFYTPGGLEGKIILDPMMGGGTTVHEAIRLGANVIGADIDPIPILQARAALTEIPLIQLKESFYRFYETLYSEIGHYYRAVCPFCEMAYEQRFTLYAVRRQCSCGKHAIFVDSFILRYNTDGSHIHISPDTYDILRDNEIVSKAHSNYGLPLREKGDPICSCGERFKEDTSLPYYKRYVPIAVVGDCLVHGLFFAAPQICDIDLIADADSRRSKLGFNDKNFEVHAGPKSIDLVNRGIHTYLELFSSRQLLYLHSAIKYLSRLESIAKVKIALLLSTSVEFNSMLCGYKGAGKRRPGAIRHVFAHHAYSFPCTVLENNPLYRSRLSGTLHNLFQNRIVRGHQWALKPIERKVEHGRTLKISVDGETDFGTEYKHLHDLREGTHRFLLFHGSSVNLDLPDQSVDHVVTDPPYYDSVQYSDLSTFFRVWLRELLPDEVTWNYSLNDAAVDQQTRGNGQYKTILRDIFKECHRVLKNEKGRLIFTFHHWNPKGWGGLTTALKEAGFVLVNRYVIHAENRSSVHIIHQNALLHDVVLVLGKKGYNVYQDWRMPQTINKKDSFGFCKECGTLLGYFLNSNLTEQHIQNIWDSKLS